MRIDFLSERRNFQCGMNAANRLRGGCPHPRPLPGQGEGPVFHLIFVMLCHTRAQGLATRLLSHNPSILLVDIHRFSLIRASWLSTRLLSRTPSIERARPFSIDIPKVSRIRALWLSIRPLSDTLSIHRAKPASFVPDGESLEV